LRIFEVIENKEAAFQLFDTAKNWLKERHIQAMDGPINFGERNAFWVCWWRVSQNRPI